MSKGPEETDNELSTDIDNFKTGATYQLLRQSTATNSDCSIVPSGEVECQGMDIF